MALLIKVRGDGAGFAAATNSLGVGAIEAEPILTVPAAPGAGLGTAADRGATWLKFAGNSILPAQVVQVAIATSEGESESDFEARCSKVPGFPLNLFDVIGPSPNAYFTPLMAALNAAYPGTGQNGDLCALIGQPPDAAIAAVGSGVAALATSQSADEQSTLLPHP